MFFYLTFLASSFTPTQIYIDESNNTRVVSAFEECQANLSAVNSFKISFSQNHGLIMIYNIAKFKASLYKDGKTCEASTSLFGYFYLKSYQDYILVEKLNNSELLSYTAIPKVKGEATTALIINSFLNFTAASAAVSEDDKNLTLTQGTTKIIFAAPLLNNYSFSFNLTGIEKASLTYFDDDGEIKTCNLFDYLGIEFRNSKTLILEFTIKETVSSAAFFKFQSFTQLSTSDSSCYNSNISDFTTQICLPNGGGDPSSIPTTNSLCICIGELTGCKKCKNMPIVPPSSGNVILTRFVQEVGRNLMIKLDGEGKDSFDVSTLTNANLRITSASADATISIKLSDVLSSLTIEQSNVNFEASDESKKVGSFYASKSYLTADGSLNAENIVTDYSSIANLGSISCTNIQINGSEVESSVKCLIKATGSVAIESFDTFSYSSNTLMFGRFSLQNFKTITLDTEKFSLDCKDSPSTSHSFNLAATTINIYGNVPSTFSFYISGKIRLYKEGNPQFNVTDDSSFVVTGKTALLLNWGSFANCNEVEIDCADLYRVTVNSDSIQITDKTLTASIPTSIKSVKFMNVLNGSFIELVKGQSLINVPSCLSFYIDDGTTTALNGWGSYNGVDKLAIIALGGVFTIRCFDPLPPNNVVIKQLDGTIIDSKYIVVPYASPVPTPANYVAEITAGTLVGIIIIFAIIFIVFFSPCGNLIGLTTYGPFGKDIHRYDSEDDDEAGLIF